MTTPRKKKAKKKAARRTVTRKKKTARASAEKGSQAAEDSSGGGFVILLDDPEPSDAKAPDKDAAKRVRLRSDCTIEEITGIQQRLLKSFDAETPVAIDLAAVERVDTAFLQLLCALVREADKRGVVLSWEKPSRSFAESAARLGVARQFQCE